MADEYAIYLRKSRADIELEKVEKFETLEKHYKRLKNIALEQELNVTKVYKEIVSGESIADRPKVQDLLEEVRKGKYKGVLVHEIERLARGDTKDQGIVAEAFKMSNTLIITPFKTFDPTNEFDEEYFEFNLFMSRREYKTIRRRMQAGIISSVMDGNFLAGIAPYGYDVIRVDKKTRTLKLNEQSDNVKMIFDWFVNERINVADIAKRLTDMNILTATGATEWTRSSVKDILSNDTYTGKIRWKKFKYQKVMTDGQLKKTRNRADRSEYILVDGKHPAIIDQETFDKAQMHFKHSVPVKLNTEIINPLAGLLRCSKCGLVVKYQSGKSTGSRPRYTHAESVSCKKKSSYADDVIETLIYSLNAIIDDFTFKMTNEYQDNERDKQLVYIKSLEKSLKETNKQKAQLFDYLERKIYSEDEFVERRNILSARIEELEKKIEEKKSTVQEKIEYEDKIYKLSQIIESLKDDNIPAKQKNLLLKEIIEKVEFTTEDLGRKKGAKITLDIFLK